MTHTHFLPAFIATLLVIALPLGAQAACYAEYKAKRENPLKLHYGVAEIAPNACTPAKAAAALAPRLAKDGWILLTIVGMIDETKLEAVKDSAGAFYLKY
ncbi:hypothetical protein [Celeribacter sp.]|uniref:hypothetical protein n=1 Tax=Celeribacter sp. TaxID=1890673 RepID=UPI003A91C25D